jgi:hypothetical protein
MNEPSKSNGASPSNVFRRERRAHARMKCVVGASCQWDGGGEAFGLVMNVSAGGARVVYWQGPQPPDHHGTLHLQTGDGFSLDISARTIHSQQCGNRWMVGYQFDRLLSDDELHKLVEMAPANEAAGR